MRQEEAASGHYMHYGAAGKAREGDDPLVVHGRNLPRWLGRTSVKRLLEVGTLARRLLARECGSPECGF